MFGPSAQIIAEALVACPQCASSAVRSPWFSVVLGSMIFLPYLIVYGVVRIIRSINANDEHNTITDSLGH